ncbi:MAG: carbohydrate kinase [Chloroflexi bacterium]|nr:carbohydrate kinase [Chloroflexota bacterium]
MTGVPGGGAIAVVGEALIDLVPAGDGRLFEAAPGGSPANVAVGLARLGVPVYLGARLADDLLGRRLRTHLADNGVDLSYAVRAAEPTSLAIVAVGVTGAPEYDFRVSDTADWQWTDAELSALPADDTLALHTGSLAATQLPGAEPLARLAERAAARVTVSYDPNCRPLLMGEVDEARARIERLIAHADVVKASAEDLAWLYPGQAPADVAERWLGFGPGLTAITLGADGVVAVGVGAGRVWRPGRRVEVVDTVGAGDAFTAAMLHGLHGRDLLGATRRPMLRGLPAATLADVLDRAVQAAALTCSRRGADPPTLTELEEPS